MAKVTLKLSDAVEFLRSVEPGSIDLIATDPAYESLEKHRAWGTTTRLSKSKQSSNEWFEIFRNERFPSFFEAAYQALAKNSHMYIYCDDETSDVIRPMGEAVGFKYWKRLVWDKLEVGMGYHWRNQTEFILFFEKGKRRLNDFGWSNVIRAKRVRKGWDGGAPYPAEKPVATYGRLILNSTELGEVVCDPFCGSSPCGAAAHWTGRRYIGVDNSEVAMRTSKARLDALRHPRLL